MQKLELGFNDAWTGLINVKITLTNGKESPLYSAMNHGQEISYHTIEIEPAKVISKIALKHYDILVCGINFYDNHSQIGNWDQYGTGSQWIE